MMNLKVSPGVLALAMLLAACGHALKKKEGVVKNTLQTLRTEVVTIDLSMLDSLAGKSRWTVTSGDEVLLSQLVDTDGDSINDQLLFQITLKPGEERPVVMEPAENARVPQPDLRTGSRFVPERIDDYAWENDRVAFRTYGPEAQRLVDEGEKGGTLSSGMDCWLKRVRRPVIDAWYKKYTEGGSYHTDSGEGYDPYHVGLSRGCGGVGVWKHDSLYVSKNFTAYRRIADGPLRTVFELSYAPWNVEDVSIQETKRISLDLGSQLCKVEVTLAAAEAIPNCTIGITLHDKKGVVHADSTLGIFQYWEPIDDSELGTGVVIHPAALLGYRDFRTPKKDLSHLYVIAKPGGTVTYYAGFAWKKAGAITTPAEWTAYLQAFAQREANPLNVSWK